MLESAADRLAMLQAVGEPFVYRTASASHEIYGVFDSAYQKVEGARGPAVAGKGLNLWVALDALCPKQGDKLFHGDLDQYRAQASYEVVSVRPDESGLMAVLVLKKL